MAQLTATPTITLTVSVDDYQALLIEHEQNQEIIDRIRNEVGESYDNVNYPAPSLFVQM